MHPYDHNSRGKSVELLSGPHGMVIETLISEA